MFMCYENQYFFLKDRISKLRVVIKALCGIDNTFQNFDA